MRFRHPGADRAPPATWRGCRDPRCQLESHERKTRDPYGSSSTRVRRTIQALGVRILRQCRMRTRTSLRPAGRPRRAGRSTHRRTAGSTLARLAPARGVRGRACAPAHPGRSPARSRIPGARRRVEWPQLDHPVRCTAPGRGIAARGVGVSNSWTVAAKDAACCVALVGTPSRSLIFTLRPNLRPAALVAEPAAARVSQRGLGTSSLGETALSLAGRLLASPRESQTASFVSR
jgi:hypothetical protein